MSKTFSETIVRRIAVCYPSGSLTRQVGRWAGGREDCAVEPVYARSRGELRWWLEGADLVVVDATDDDAQAVDAFAQAIAHKGAARVVVYTERMHDGLELFVRKQGSWLLLGPLDTVQWEGLFSRLLRMVPEGQPHVHRRRAA